MLVGLTGYAGSGKDTAAAGLTAIGWKRVSFAEPLRQMLLTLNPIVGHRHYGTVRLQDVVEEHDWLEAKKLGEVRRLMQVLGTEIGREMIDDDLWIKLAKKSWDDYFSFGYDVVVTDVRFKNEADAIRFNGGKIIRIHREGVKPVNNHVSDTGVDLLSVDHEIINNGSVEDLQNTLKTLLQLSST
jgi:hypothetical protein